MAYEVRAGRYGTRWTSLGAISTSLTKYLDYDRRRLALVLMMVPPAGGSSILVIVGDIGGGFAYRSRNDDPGFVGRHFIRRYESGTLCCGEVYALMTASLGTLTVLEYLDYEL